MFLLVHYVTATGKESNSHGFNLGKSGTTFVALLTLLCKIWRHLLCKGTRQMKV